MSRLSAFDHLQSYIAHLHETGIRTLLEEDPARAVDFALSVGPLYVNFSRQRYDRTIWTALPAVAESKDMTAAFRRLFDGEIVNVTEDRAALHTALRSDLSAATAARHAHHEALEVRRRMRLLIERLADTQVTDIVSVGIGGSDLGPRLVVDALKSVSSARFRVHFISNVDGAAAQRTLAALDPAYTAAVFIS
ncbi:MAG: glucose-6-phosphate isomerase, partial [Xanthomonadaceae bacterium]|nr:glucose-6-phosphate isomerase [Xanthomonadaceae bacterium]